jgi:gliding motility-associated-like protein
MKIRQLILISMAAFMPIFSHAQSVSPSAVYTNDEGTQIESHDNIAGQAPLSVNFYANPSDMEGIDPIYEWHFRQTGEDKDLMVRYEENTDYTFTNAGETRVTLFVKENNSTEILDSATLVVTVSESKLVFPNAFSPNGDEKNPTFKPKEYQSIVEFHAYIFNRWGQKLYEWSDPSADGWDGTYNGKPVKDGVYFVLCKAKGADGRVYNIRKDVNLLRGFTDTTDHE